MVCFGIGREKKKHKAITTLNSEEELKNDKTDKISYVCLDLSLSSTSLRQKTHHNFHHLPGFAIIPTVVLNYITSNSYTFMFF